MEKLWFAAKQYGYGWYPITWEGTAVTLHYVLLIIVPIPLLPLAGPDGDWVAFVYLPYALVLTALLIWICVKKGEEARWRWGGK